jgi:hypothetical protein
VRFLIFLSIHASSGRPHFCLYLCFLLSFSDVGLLISGHSSRCTDLNFCSILFFFVVPLDFGFLVLDPFYAVEAGSVSLPRFFFLCRSVVCFRSLAPNMSSLNSPARCCSSRSLCHSVWSVPRGSFLSPCSFSLLSFFGLLPSAGSRSN